MDLIYADETRKDIGVLQSYSMDMAFGADENNFTCSVERSSHCCQRGYYIYVDGEEYGGVVDGIAVDTDQDSVTYSGRTWHGILQSHAVCPPAGDDYVLLDGEANTVLQEIFQLIGMTDLFVASTEDSGIEVAGYQMPRYAYAYSAIREMLKAFDAKLKLVWSGGMVVASAEPRYDYSQDEEFDTSQIGFRISRNFRPVNHIICLGQGNLRDRAVIHIFADDAGGIQDYLKDPAKEAVEDDDYILDTSKQVLTGQDDVQEVYDYPNADITYNYVPLTSKPEAWEKECTSFYYYEPTEETEDGETVDAGGEYKPVEMIPVGYRLQRKQPYDWAEAFDEYFTYDSASDQYSPVSGVETYEALTSRPGSWARNYGRYYTKSGSTYTPASGTTVSTYSRQKKRPRDWKKAYGNYYYFYSDGVTSEYRRVSGVTHYSYKQQSNKPTDWATSYGSYYRRATAKELASDKSKRWRPVEKTKKGKVPAWKAKTYYTRISSQKAPAWKTKTYYTRTDRTTAPTWATNTFYMKVGSTAPAWSRGKYYTATSDVVAPAWAAGRYFRQAVDRYAVMVAEAVQKLEEYQACDELEIDLEATDRVYDVGDITGSREQVTGLEAVQEVIKKIIKITNDDVVISYEVG